MVPTFLQVSWFESNQQGVLLRLRVQPRASTTKLVGLYGDPPRLKIRLAASPVDGKANQELIHFLKENLGVRLDAIKIIRGELSTLKDVLCVGVSIGQMSSLFPINDSQLKLWK